MGSSIKDRITQINNHFCSWENSVTVNRAREYFNSKFWLFLDPHLAFMYPQTDIKPVTSYQAYENIIRKKKDFKVHELISDTSSNTGIFGVKYALLKGATRIIVAGLDLTDKWGYLDDKVRHLQDDPYVKLMRSEFIKLNKSTRTPILSVDKNNILGLDYYDIEGEN